MKSNDIKQLIMKRIRYLEHIRAQTEKLLPNYPVGSLRISMKKGQPQFFQRLDPSDRRGKYLKKQDYTLAKELVEKNYYEKIYHSASEELKLMQAFLKKYTIIPPEEVYERLSDIRQNLINPLIETDKLFCERWSSVQYKGKYIPENSPEFITDRGERVRSKSELIIANILAKEYIPYRYEYPITLKGFGIVYPDFTVLNVRQRKEYYWEHMGMMDDPEYAEKAARKMLSYNKNNIYPGTKLILTIETRNVPISVRQVNMIINHFLR